VLSRFMNKGIPDIFSKLGVKTFFQDMISPEAMQSRETELLLRNIPWHHAAMVLEMASAVANTKNLTRYSSQLLNVLLIPLSSNISRNCSTNIINRTSFSRLMNTIQTWV